MGCGCWLVIIITIITNQHPYHLYTLLLPTSLVMGETRANSKTMFVLPVCTLTLNLYCHPKSSHDDMLPLISVGSWWHHISLTFFSYPMHKTKNQTTHYDAHKRTWQHFCISILRLHRGSVNDSCG